MNLSKQHVEKVLPLGYVLITKDMKLPTTFEEIKFLPFDQGPINTRVEKPFRIWDSPIDSSPESEPHQAALDAYRSLLVTAWRAVKGIKKGSFVLYVEHRALNLDSKLVGGIFKYA